MDSQTYEEARMKRDESWAKWVKEGDSVNLVFWDGKVITVELPKTVTVVVAESDPGLQGGRSSAGTKAVTLETGAVVQVQKSNNLQISINGAIYLLHCLSRLVSIYHKFVRFEGSALHVTAWTLVHHNLPMLPLFSQRTIKKSFWGVQALAWVQNLLKIVQNIALTQRHLTPKSAPMSRLFLEGLAIEIALKQAQWKLETWPSLAGPTIHRQRWNNKSRHKVGRIPWQGLMSLLFIWRQLQPSLE